MNVLLPYTWYLDLIKKNKQENTSTNKAVLKKDWALVNRTGNQ